MKRKMIKGAAVAVLMAVVLSTPLAAEAQTARVMLDGKSLTTSVAPLVKGGRTLVPMRDIFEALGASVVWDAQSQEINAQKGEARIWLQIGQRMARVGEDQKWLETAPVIHQGSTLVPLRFVAEALQANVTWDGAQRLVSITSHERLAGTPDEENNTEVRGSITVPSGAVVPVTLDETLSSKDARVGDTFTATVKSDQAGDSEFPAGTKLQGRISEARSKAEESPGLLGVEFTGAILPDGTRVALQGELISLDDDSVTQQSRGRIMAKKGSGGNDKLKIIGIGAAAGFILGKVLDKNSIITAIIGAAGGYLYSKSKDKGKEQEAIVEQGTTLGVRLNRSVTYTDTSGYADERLPYLG